MRKIIVLQVVLLIFLSACTNKTMIDTKNNDNTADIKNESITDNGTNDGNSFTIKVQESDGKLIEGAYVTLINREQLYTLSGNTNDKGTVSFVDNLEKKYIANGKYFLNYNKETKNGTPGIEYIMAKDVYLFENNKRIPYFIEVIANGYIGVKKDFDKGESDYEMIITMEKRDELKPYIMTFVAKQSEDSNGTVYLLHSDDGVNFEIFPNFVPFEGESASVTYNDGYINLYSNSRLFNYNISFNKWASGKQLLFSAEPFKESTGSFFYGYFTKDISFTKDKDNNLLMIGKNGNGEFYSDIDFIRGEFSVIGWSKEVEDSVGLQYHNYYDRYMIAIKGESDYNTPFMITTDHNYQLFVTRVDGLQLYENKVYNDYFDVSDDYIDGYIYNGECNGINGFLDDGKYNFYFNKNVNGLPSIYHCNMDSLSIIDDSMLEEINIIGLDINSYQYISSPVVSKIPLNSLINNKSDDYSTDVSNMKFNNFSKTDTPGSFTGGASLIKSDFDIESKIKSNTCFIAYSNQAKLAYDYYLSIMVTLDNLKASGIVYNWNDEGMNIGGYAFICDGSKWRLEKILPPASYYGGAMNGFKANHILLAEGDYVIEERFMDKKYAILTVNYDMGIHRLYIDGEFITEYDEKSNIAAQGDQYLYSSEESAFASGDYGYYAESFDDAEGYLIGYAPHIVK